MVAYLITEEVVAACWAGLEEKGWSQAELARRIGTERANVNNVLHRRSIGSDIVLDMLKALDKPVHLALALDDAEKLMLDSLGPGFKSLPPDRQATLMENWKRDLAGEIALVSGSGKKST